MEIKNKEITLIAKGSLIDSIKYKGTEILNTTKNWTKKSPIIFPGIASGKSFTVNDKVYEIPRHGFWNDINFKIEKQISGITMTAKVEHPSYPFNIEIDHYIHLNKNKVILTTAFTGPKIPIQFGYHPAFNYDKGDINIKQNNVHVVYKDMTSGFENVDINNLSELPWDKVDTFIFETKSIELINEKYSIEVSTNMKYIAVWTNGDKFICFEPWSNLPATIEKDDNEIMGLTPYIMEIEIKENK